LEFLPSSTVGEKNSRKGRKSERDFSRRAYQTLGRSPRNCQLKNKKNGEEEVEEEKKLKKGEESARVEAQKVSFACLEDNIVNARARSGRTWRKKRNSEKRRGSLSARQNALINAGLLSKVCILVLKDPGEEKKSLKKKKSFPCEEHLHPGFHVLLHQISNRPETRKGLIGRFYILLWGTVMGTCSGKGVKMM